MFDWGKLFQHSTALFELVELPRQKTFGQLSYQLLFLRKFNLVELKNKKTINLPKQNID